MPKQKQQFLIDQEGMPVFEQDQLALFPPHRIISIPELEECIFLFALLLRII